MRPRPALALLLTVALTACVAPGADVPEDDTAGLQQPTFTPLAGTSPPSASDVAATSGPATPPPPSPTGTPSDTMTPEPSTAAPTGTGEPTSPATPTAAPTASTLRGVLTDGTDDLSGLQSGQAPEYADLREVTLTMGGAQGRITLGFAGPAPEAGEGDEILNVATYHDVTGDGNVDYEIWASLTADGWGTSWYDIRNGTARFAAEDDVEVEVVDGVVVLTFPPSHLDDARSGRWLASSEWGTALSMSSGTSATDDAPDDRSGTAWPT